MNRQLRCRPAIINHPPAIRMPFWCLQDIPQLSSRIRMSKATSTPNVERHLISISELFNFHLLKRRAVYDFRCRVVPQGCIVKTCALAVVKSVVSFDVDAALFQQSLIKKSPWDTEIVFRVVRGIRSTKCARRPAVSCRKLTRLIVIY